MTPLLIRHKDNNALGDVMLMTALIRDIHRAYPGQYRLSVQSNFRNVWRNNPYVVPKEENPDAKRVDVDWGRSIKTHGYIDWPSGRTPRHILAWYHQTFYENSKILVPVTTPRADLHLTDEEQAPLVQGRYWVIVAGGKSDATVKHWHLHRAQEVVDKLRARGIRCVQVGAFGSDQMHKPLERVVNLLGQTPDARMMWNVVKYSDGVVCGVTGPMHAAAAFERPCVVYAGGREDPWFEAYTDQYGAFGPGAESVRVPHRFLHTIGKLDCCATYGCWAARTVPIRDQLDMTRKTRKYYKMCQKPVFGEGIEPIAACQDLITSDQVVAAVLSYYADNTLPPPDDREPVFTGPIVPPPPPKPPAPVRMNPPRTLPRALPTGLAGPVVRHTPRMTVPPRITKDTARMPNLTMLPVPELDDPRLGGKITICVLCYGPYPDLAERCLRSILLTVPPDRIDLRIGANEPSARTVEQIHASPATKFYIHDTNAYKYPVMREMLYDPTAPITTKYMLWFDDDTWVNDSTWLQVLCRTILAADDKTTMFGTPMYHDLKMYTRPGYDPRDWFRKAAWFKGRNFRKRTNSAEDPAGTIIDFAVGWHWALRTDMLKTGMIPDSRLQHNGGDITIGEQIHQAGCKIGTWNTGKSYVACPSKADGGRRGFSQPFPWALPG